MGFLCNKMLFLHVLVAFLAIGDCSLTPMLRPLLSLLDTPAPSVKNGNPTHSSYRTHGPMPPSISMSSGRRGGANIDAHPVIIPAVTTHDGGISSKTPISKVLRTRLLTPRMDEWTVKNPEISVKYLNRIGKIDGDKRGLTFRTGNEIPKVSVNPLKKVYTGMKSGLIVDGSGEGEGSKSVIVKPLKGGYRRMLIYGDSREDGGMMRDRSNELGSNEQSWGTSKWSGEDTGHDSEDQADHNRRGIKTYWRRANIPADSKEDMERIVIVANPVSARSHKRYHTKDASRKHTLRRAYKILRSGDTACPFCSEIMA